MRESVCVRGERRERGARGGERRGGVCVCERREGEKRVCVCVERERYDYERATPIEIPASTRERNKEQER